MGAELAKKKTKKKLNLSLFSRGVDNTSRAMAMGMVMGAELV